MAKKKTEKKRIRIRTVSVKKIRKARLPLNNGDRVDLEMVFDSLRGTRMDVRYDPESPFKALYVIVGRASYCFFPNGTVTIAGNVTIKSEEQILLFLWEKFLKHSTY
jgi:hypothetical protein